MAETRIQVLDRAFDIFEVLARSKDPVPLGVLAQAVGMSKTTVFRILHTMSLKGLTSYYNCVKNSVRIL